MDLTKLLGPEAEQHVNASGGRQSISPFALDVAPLALLRVGHILYRGEQKNEDAPQLVKQENWRNISSREHARHMLNHLLDYLAGLTDDDPMEHCVARGLFIIERDQEKPAPAYAPKNNAHRGLLRGNATAVVLQSKPNGHDRGCLCRKCHQHPDGVRFCELCEP